MISYLLPTRDRHDRLQQTLAALAQLDWPAHDDIGGAEVIIVDNASRRPVEAPRRLANGIEVRVLRRETNEGAAARNAGVAIARGEWLIMLDDDSFPLNCGHFQAITDAEDDVAAIGAEVMLSNGKRESGGLPEVIVGCGAAIRRSAFLAVDGYDPTFDYYAEEYDLCAKLILKGWRIVHDLRFRVIHEKTSAGRDMNRILHRLVRNNCWVMQRYAPDELRQDQIHHTIARYAQIAMKEHAAAGFARGMSDLLDRSSNGFRSPMPIELFERFTGIAHVRETLRTAFAELRVDCVSIIDPGKNAWVVRKVLCELGLEVCDDLSGDALVIGTLSPGPMLDAYQANGSASVLLPWEPRSMPFATFNMSSR